MSLPPPEPLSAAPPPDWVAQNLQPHESAVRKFLRSQFPSIDDDDVVQESYLKVLRSRATGRIVSAKNYFFSVARNTAVTIFRRRRIYSEVPVNELPDAALIADDPNAAELAEHRLRLELAVAAIDGLPDRCRKVFQLAMIERLPRREIARKLGMAEATVDVQMAKGLKRCADFVRAKGERT